MYRKVKVKPILELIFAKQSNSQIADSLKVSRPLLSKINKDTTSLIFLIHMKYHRHKKI